MYDIDKVYGFYYNFYLNYNYGLLERALTDEAREAMLQYYPAQSIREILKSAVKESTFEITDEESGVTEIREYGWVKDWIDLNGLAAKTLFFPTEGKKGNHNKMMDIMQAVMKHKDTARKIVKTSSFQNIKDIRGMVQDIKAGDSINAPLNPSLPQTLSTVSNRMLTGKNLIGPLANINSIIALLQQSNIQFNFPMLFNGIKYTALNMVEYKGIRPSDTIGNWNAAIVDNGKDPVAGDLNVNWATIDVLIAMLATGVDMRTALMFLNEAEVVQYAQVYQNNGGNFQAEELALEDYVGGPDEAMVAKLKTHNYLLGSVQNYVPGDLKTKGILPTFLFYKKLGNDLNTLVMGLKTFESGLGSSAGHTEAKRQQVEDAINLETKKDSLITGTSFVADTRYVHKGIANAAIQGTNTIIKALGLTDLRGTGLYADTMSTLQRIKYAKSGMRLTKNEIDHMIHNLKMYLVSEVLPYIPNHVENFPKEFLAFKKDNPQYAELLNAFEVENNQVLYRGVNTEVAKQRERYYKLIKGMMDTPGADLFIYKLGLYEFYIDGFGASPKGFSHVLPLDWFLKHANITTGKMNDLGDPTQTDIFIQQYFRNYPEISWIPDLKKKDKVTSPVYKSKRSLFSQAGVKIANLGVTNSGAVNKLGGKILHAYRYGDAAFSDKSTDSTVIVDKSTPRSVSITEAYKNNKGGTPLEIKECK